jgi:hypothetical protein
LRGRSNAFATFWIYPPRGYCFFFAGSISYAIDGRCAWLIGAGFSAAGLEDSRRAYVKIQKDINALRCWEEREKRAE